MRTRKTDPGDFQKSLGSSNDGMRIALRCRGDLLKIQATLDRMPSPVDVWLHPNRRHLAALINSHPMTGRLLFSPVRDTRIASNANSAFPVYGAYGKVIDV